MALRILLADDSMTAQNMGKKILTDAGYEVVAVSNGAAAVKKIAEHKPDVAVLDVYMPGYTGLEVCERLKSALETTRMPVLLTVGKMEPFKPEEGARVRADGVIVKPFEASDLLAAVQKLEQQLNPAAASAAAQSPAYPGGQATVMITSDEPPEYERTVKIRVPVFDEKDASYQTWKSEAEEHVDEHLPPTKLPSTANVDFPTEMRAAPALGLDHFDEEPAADPQRTTQALDSRSTSALAARTEELNPHEVMAEAQEVTQPEEESLQTVAPVAEPAMPAETVLFGSLPPAEETMRQFEAVQSYGAAKEVQQEPPAAESALPEASLLEPTITAPVEIQSHSTDPNVEFTSASRQETHDISAGTAPGLEVTSMRADEETPPGGAIDSELITDVSEMSAAFPTRFGKENADVVPVGNAADFPGLYGSAPADAVIDSNTPAEQEMDSVETAPQSDVTQEIEIPAVQTAPAPADDFDTSTATASQSGWTAEEAHLEEHERGVALHEEMEKQFAAVPPESATLEPEPATQTEAPVQAEAPVQTAPPFATPENAPDEQLAAAMAAAMGSAMEPQLTGATGEPSAAEGDSTMSLDKHTALIAEIVHRVTERMKPNLVAEIAKELAAEISKKEK